MAVQRERKCMLTFYVSDDEKAFILKKMEVAKISNLSAYLRKVAIDGKIEIRDLSELKEMNYNLRKIGNTINQIAKRINETNTVYNEDIEDIKNQMNEIWILQKTILTKIPKIKTCNKMY